MMVLFTIGVVLSVKKILILVEKVEIENGLANNLLWADRSMVDRCLGNLTRMAKVRGSSPRRSIPFFEKLDICEMKTKNETYNVSFPKSLKHLNSIFNKLQSDYMGITRVKEKKSKEEIEEKAGESKIKKVKKEVMKEIVRVSGTDLDGDKPLIHALKKIKGIGHSMSKAICIASGIDGNKRLGSLTESEIKKVEEVIKDPIKFSIPAHLVNRRRNRKTGKDLHITGPDLDVVKKFDIQRMIDIKSYKGIRHMFGLPVRGQRTRSSFRKGRVVGVVRKSVRIVQEKSKEKK